MAHNRIHISPSEWILVALLVIICSAVSFSVIDDGHDWRGDFAMYVEQGQALLNGTTNELYELNRYCMDKSETNLGPYLYQPGFPILLSIILLLFGLNFYAMKGLCAAALAFSIPLIFKLTRPFFRSAFYPFVIVTSVVFHASYITFTDSILSDLPFLFFSLLTLFLVVSGDSWRNRLLLGFTMFFSYLIRDVGIVLLASLFVFDLHRWITMEKPKLIEKLSTYVLFMVLFVVGSFIRPAGQENHIAALFTEVSWEIVSGNMEYYRVLMTRYFYLGDHPSLLFYPMLTLMLFGAVSIFRKAPHLVLYVILTLIILFIWPYKQGVRFLFPILPFLTLFAVKGLEMIIPSNFRNWTRIAVASWLLSATYFSSSDIIEYAKRDTNLCYTDEMKSVYAVVSSEVPKEEVVVHYYPRVFRLFTGRNAVRISQYEFDLSDEYRYYQNSTAYVDPNIVAKYQVVFETENEILLKK